jgi:hypothetical protein
VNDGIGRGELESSRAAAPASTGRRRSSDRPLVSSKDGQSITSPEDPMSRTFVCGALAVLLVASNVAWVYVVMDQSVTIEHHASERNRRGEQVAALAELMVTYPRDAEASDAHRLLRKALPDRVVKLAGDTVEVDDFSFVHQSGRLVRVVPF